MEFKIDKGSWRKIGVYCITNTVNNKIYIGSTTTNFRHRYLQYCSGFKRKLDNQPILYRAFRKYGFENFVFELVCVCKKENAILMEQFYINNGVDYNSCLVAGSLSGLKHSENSKTRTIKGGLHHSSKAVFQFSKDGVFIKKHNSIIEALISLGKSKNGSSHISQSCLGVTYSSFGFRWSFTETLKDRENRLGKNKTALAKGDFYKEFPSQKAAAEYLKLIGFKSANQGRINRSLSKTKEKVYGYTIIKL
jgi:group I intron endonuclease